MFIVAIVLMLIAGFFVRDLDKFYGNTRREIEHLVEICGAGLFLFLWIATPLDFNQAWLTTSIVLCVVAIPATLFLKKRNEEIEDELAFSEFLFLFSSTLAKVYCYEELSSADIRAMEGVFKKLELTDEQVDFCINSFRKCENEDWDIDEILCDIESKFDIEVRETLYELVWEVVSSTSNLSEGKIDTLKAMERMLYLPLGAYERCKRKFSSRGSDFKYNGTKRGFNLEEAYKEFGCTGNETNEELKTKYREIMKQYHPDILVSKGLPKELMEIARRKVVRFNDAWEKIKQERSIS